MTDNGINGVTTISHDLDNELGLYLKLLILLYADNTVLISETAADLQHSLNKFQEYCTQWKLTVNTMKTKIVICSKGRSEHRFDFILNDQN